MVSEEKREEGLFRRIGKQVSSNKKLIRFLALAGIPITVFLKMNVNDSELSKFLESHKNLQNQYGIEYVDKSKVISKEDNLELDGNGAQDAADEYQNNGDVGSFSEALQNLIQNLNAMNKNQMEEINRILPGGADGTARIIECMDFIKTVNNLDSNLNQYDKHVTIVGLDNFNDFYSLASNVSADIKNSNIECSIEALKNNEDARKELNKKITSIMIANGYVFDKQLNDLPMTISDIIDTVIDNNAIEVLEQNAKNGEEEIDIADLLASVTILKVDELTNTRDEEKAKQELNKLDRSQIAETKAKEMVKIYERVVNTNSETTQKYFLNYCLNCEKSGYLSEIEEKLKTTNNSINNSIINEVEYIKSSLKACESLEIIKVGERKEISEAKETVTKMYMEKNKFQDAVKALETNKDKIGNTQVFVEDFLKRQLINNDDIAKVNTDSIIAAGFYTSDSTKLITDKNLYARLVRLPENDIEFEKYTIEDIRKMYIELSDLGLIHTEMPVEEAMSYMKSINRINTYETTNNIDMKDKELEKANIVKYYARVNHMFNLNGQQNEKCIENLHSTKITNGEAMQMCANDQIGQRLTNINRSFTDKYKEAVGKALVSGDEFSIENAELINTLTSVLSAEARYTGSTDIARKFGLPENTNLNNIIKYVASKNNKTYKIEYREKDAEVKKSFMNYFEDELHKNVHNENKFNQIKKALAPELSEMSIKELRDLKYISPELIMMLSKKESSNVEDIKKAFDMFKDINAANKILMEKGISVKNHNVVEIANAMLEAKNNELDNKEIISKTVFELESKDYKNSRLDNVKNTTFVKEAVKNQIRKAKIERDVSTNESLITRVFCELNKEVADYTSEAKILSYVKKAQLTETASDEQIKDVAKKIEKTFAKDFSNKKKKVSSEITNELKEFFKQYNVVTDELINETLMEYKDSDLSEIKQALKYKVMNNKISIMVIELSEKISNDCRRIIEDNKENINVDKIIVDMVNDNPEKDMQAIEELAKQKIESLKITKEKKIERICAGLSDENIEIEQFITQKPIENLIDEIVTNNPEGTVQECKTIIDQLCMDYKESLKDDKAEKFTNGEFVVDAEQQDDEAAANESEVDM